MSDLVRLSGVEQKLDFGAVKSVFDPKRDIGVTSFRPLSKGSFKPIQCNFQPGGQACFVASS